MWTTIAVVAFVVSLGAPLSGHGIADTDRAVPACLNLVVATTVIVVLGRIAGRNTAGHTSHADRHDVLEVESR